MNFWRLPSCLVVHLRRFQWNNPLGLNSKLSYLVDFPLSGLSLAPGCAPGATPSPTYELVGVSSHHGVPGGGHYTAAVRLGDQWFVCDDERVFAVSPADVITPDAYILFYRVTASHRPVPDLTLPPLPTDLPASRLAGCAVASEVEAETS